MNIQTAKMPIIALSTSLLLVGCGKSPEKLLEEEREKARVAHEKLVAEEEAFCEALKSIKLRRREYPDINETMKKLGEQRAMEEQEEKKRKNS